MSTCRCMYFLYVRLCALVMNFGVIVYTNCREPLKQGKTSYSGHEVVYQSKVFSLCPSGTVYPLTNIIAKR